MKNKFIYLLSAGLLVGVSGCDKIKDFGNTNLSPNGITEPSIAGLMTRAQIDLVGYAATGTVPIMGAQYAQYISETQYSQTSLYSAPQLAHAGNYSGTLFDLQNIINLDQSKNMSAIAKIIKEYIFWTITDAWGDVPYSESLKGLDVINPAYDTQEQIYKGVLANLKEAVDQFDGTSPITGDILFNGNVAGWKRVANSVRMLAAIQLSKKYPGSSDYAATEFKAALNDPAGYITNNSQNFVMNYPAAGSNYKNPYFNMYNGRKDYGLSKTVTDLLASLGDVRGSAWGGSSEDAGSTGSSAVGVPYGLNREKLEVFTSTNPTWAKVLRGDLRKEGSPFVIVSAAEVALARAEAADRGWTSESLTSVYQQGIALSHEQWGVAAPSAAYLNGANVALTAAAGTGANIRNISVQRYLASFPDGHKGWNIWRKSGFPVLTPAPDATNSSKQIVQRFIYATGELTTNEASVKAAIARIPGGVDSQDAKVWWNQ